MTPYRKLLNSSSNKLTYNQECLILEVAISSDLEDSMVYNRVTPWKTVQENDDACVSTEDSVNDAKVQSYEDDINDSVADTQLDNIDIKEELDIKIEEPNVIANYLKYADELSDFDKTLTNNKECIKLRDPITSEITYVMYRNSVPSSVSLQDNNDIILHQPGDVYVATGELFSNIKVEYNDRKLEEVHLVAEGSPSDITDPVNDAAGLPNTSKSILPFEAFESSESEYVQSDSDSDVSTTNYEELESHKKKFTHKIDEIEKMVDKSSCSEEPTSKAIKSKLNKHAPVELEKINRKKRIKIADAVLVSTTSDIEPLSNHVKIVAATKDIQGKRVRSKGHACYFCQKIHNSSARHLEICHGKETEVAKILAMPKNSKVRRDSFINLIRIGDFYHNCEIISMKEGELILVRRPTVPESKFVSFNDYGPCPQCLGFMLKKHLWHHIKKGCACRKSSDVDRSRHVIAESNALLNETFGRKFSTDFILNISSKMRDDVVGKYCKEDNLILKYGAMQFEKYGTTQRALIMQSMRQLSRFTLKLREIENTQKCLSDYLIPQKFNLLVEATKSLCISHQNTVQRSEFKIPSLAMKIGFALKKCASIKRGTCLRAGDISGSETIICFLNLIVLEWSTRVSSNTSATIYNKKISETELLPLTGDIDIEKKIDREDRMEHNNSNYYVPFCYFSIVIFHNRTI